MDSQNSWNPTQLLTKRKYTKFKMSAYRKRRYYMNIWQFNKYLTNNWYKRKKCRNAFNSTPLQDIITGLTTRDISYYFKEIKKYMIARTVISQGSIKYLEYHMTCEATKTHMITHLSRRWQTFSSWTWVCWGWR